jgi:hypothetical protein
MGQLVQLKGKYYCLEINKIFSDVLTSIELEHLIVEGE